MSNGVRYTPTFALPSEYEQQAMEARRRRRMAEMLAQQAYQPQDVGVAPIPSAAPLVQGLQAFLTARQLRKAEEAAEKASQTESEYAKRLAGRLAGGYVPDFNVPAAEVPEQTELGEVTLTSQKRPAETLQQYQDRMRTAQFTNPTFDQMLARTPEQTALEPITPTARYKRSPEEALAMAETDVGMAAMKNRPMLAARLAQLLEKPESAEFGTSPQYDAEGRAYVINKAGEIKYLAGVRKPEEAKAKPTKVQEYEYAVGQGYKGTFTDWERDSQAAGATKIMMPGEGERKDAYNLNRIVVAQQQITDVIDKNPEAFGPSGIEATAEALGAGDYAYLTQDPSRQIVAAAQADMIDALLTLATGAAYTAEQLKAQRSSFLPRWNESEESKNAKRARLRGLVQQARVRAGRAWNPELDAAIEKAFPVAPPKSKTSNLTPDQEKRLAELERKSMQRGTGTPK